MTWTPGRVATGLNRGARGSGRVITGRGQAKPTEAQMRYERRHEAPPPGRVKCHACYRDVLVRKDGTMHSHAYCLASGTVAEPIPTTTWEDLTMPATPKATATATEPTPWERLRAPFPPENLERLPKPVRKDDQDKGRCEQGTRYSADGHYCGGWHTRSVHLSYVGHAGVTDRLNDVDPEWNWEPMALTDQGTPLFSDDGLWIRMTVLGVSRLGFGDAQGKRGANAVKEIIGDAIRNAAMRYGVGTYLWSKSPEALILQAGGDLDATQGEGAPPVQGNRQQARRQQGPPPNPLLAPLTAAIEQAGLSEQDKGDLRAWMVENHGADADPRRWTREQVHRAYGWVNGDPDLEATRDPNGADPADSDPT